jgi:type I restriction enzyme S subunit
VTSVDVPLLELCRPKQWPTLSMVDLSPAGFPVYGANGPIGFADRYTHEKPVLLIGCRGSCGTLHITPPKAYANGNAMALDDLDQERVDLRYLYFYFQYRGFADVVSGSSQPQITRQGLSRVVVPVPSGQDSLAEQRRIARILDKADAIRRRRKEAIALTEELLRSAFLEMFSDPVTNPKGWPVKPLARLGRITTGNTPSRAVAAYFGDDIEWIKSDNINTPSHYLSRATEGLSAQGRAVGRTAPAGSTLMTCIAGSPDCIGNVALADREVAFNQQINAVTPHDGVDYRFLYVLLLVGKRLVQAASTNSMKGMVSKGKLEDVLVPAPPPKAQAQFGQAFDRVLRLSRRQEAAQSEAQTLFDTTVQRAFSGELAS